MKKSFYSLMALMLILGGCNPKVSESVEAMKSTTLTSAELLEWDFYGIGSVSDISGQLCLKEETNSKGVMIVSPQAFEENVVLKYKVLALTPATVIVNLFSFSDGNVSDLAIEEGFDGGMAPINDKPNYFVAFKNAPHGLAPFVKKNPGGMTIALGEVDKIIPGIYSDVEIGQDKGELWLKVDGKELLRGHDENYLKGGRFSLRLRGTAGFPAAVLIKDFSISVPK